MAEDRYQAKYDGPASMAYNMPFIVIDTESGRVMAYCRDIKTARHVASALQFSWKPSRYGYKLVD